MGVAQAFRRVVDQPCSRMRKNIFEIYTAKSAVVLRFEADVMNNADTDRTGDIALDFDASASLPFSAHLEIVFPECPVDHCSCGGDRLQQDHRLPRQLFQADLSEGKAHAPARTSKVSLGRNQRNPSRSTKECGKRPMARSASPEGAIEIASAWLLARRPNSMQGMRRGSGQSSADTNNAGTPEPPERFSR